MEIKGKKVILRSWQKGDAKELMLLVQDRQISRFTRVPWPYKLKDAKKFIRECGEKGKKKTEFGFAVISLENKKIVGSIGIMTIDRHSRKAEIGYLLGKEHRGRGYMAEAVQLALGFAFGKLKLNRVRISCSTKNKASRKVIEKAGARFEGIERESMKSGDGKMHNLRVYSILKRELKRDGHCTRQSNSCY